MVITSIVTTINSTFASFKKIVKIENHHHFIDMMFSMGHSDMAYIAKEKRPGREINLTSQEKDFVENSVPLSTEKKIAIFGE